MADSGWELQQAIYAALASNGALTALLGGPNIFDDVPQRADFPYLTFGRSSIRDWSTGTEEGSEHLLTLHVWSREAGRRQVRQIMSLLRATLHDQPLALTGHHLVNLRHELSEARREPDGDTYRGIVRFRAVTEPNV